VEAIRPWDVTLGGLCKHCAGSPEWDCYGFFTYGCKLLPPPLIVLAMLTWWWHSQKKVKIHILF